MYETEEKKFNIVVIILVDAFALFIARFNLKTSSTLITGPIKHLVSIGLLYLLEQVWRSVNNRFEYPIVIAFSFVIAFLLLIADLFAFLMMFMDWVFH